MPACPQLADEERDQIAVMKAAGHSLGAIARALRLRIHEPPSSAWKTPSRR